MCAGSALIGTGCSQNGHSIVSSATVSRTRSREISDQFLLRLTHAQARPKIAQFPQLIHHAT